VVAAAAVAVLVFISGRAEGSYYASAWPLLGAVLVVAAIALMLLQAPVALWPAASAAALVALGLVAVASTAWGGLPDIAWKTLDESVIGAAALLVGSFASAFARNGTRLVLGGVLAATVAMAVELLYRLQAGTAPDSWFDGRKVEGPVSYHNAQGAIFAIAVPLALWASTRRAAPVRAAGGLSCVALIAAMLVTQSRGALLAALLATALQVAVARDARLVAHAVLAALLGAALVIPFRHVDAALVDDPGHAVTQFRSFAGWSVLAAIVLAAVAALPLTSLMRRCAVAVSAVAVIGAIAFAVPHLGEVGPKLDRALNGEEPTSLPGGQTRLSSLSLTGRTQIWRVALDSYRDAPVLGHGSGSFTAIFTRDRTNKDLYVLQPHSIELEMLDELGIPGALAFVAFVAFLFVGLIRGRGSRAARAAAAGALVALVGQASVDWTFSFPALVVAVLLVVGAAIGPGTLRVRATPGVLGAAAIGLVALLAFAGPYLANRHLADAKGAATSQKAWDLLRQARGFDPWNADVVDYQGQVAEVAGRYQEAARLYAHAATLARLSWVEEYRRARALREGHFTPAATAACLRARALNPLEQLLDHGACEGVR
jgi:hypothetical protein